MIIMSHGWVLGLFHSCSFSAVETQSHRMGQAEETLRVGSSAPTSLLGQGPPRARGRGLHPGISWISPIRETLQPLWTTCSGVWWPVQSRSSSSCSTGTCCALLPAASCPIAWHLREEPGSFLWHSPFSTYGQWWSPLSIVSSGGWTGPVPSAFPWEMVQSPHHLWSP